MLPILVTIGALSVLTWDMTRPLPRPVRPFWLHVIRALPFAISAALSVVVAGRAPQGRHSFDVDFSLAVEDVARSMTKVAHWRSIAILFLLAVVAFGVRRLWVAFAVTMAVGVAWEFAEATVVSHYARLADLVPNLVSGLLSLGLVAGLRWALARRDQHLKSEPP